MGVFALLWGACEGGSVKKQTIETTFISDAWQFRKAGSTKWYAATVPGTVHTDLLNSKQIKDPFYRTNEKQQQWIDKEDWEYKTKFNADQGLLNKTNISLLFEGLDTYADVYLNDSLIVSADNMFRTWDVDIKQYLKKGENSLRVYFHSPIRKGLKLLEANGYPLPASNDQSENGGTGDKKVSIFTRKAGYHYGWDWGPRFVTSGIWRPVSLIAYNYGKLDNVFVRQNKVTKKNADLTFETNFETNEKYNVELKVKDKASGKLLVSQKMTTKIGANTMTLNASISEPKLWWSRGLGEPHLYSFEVELLAEGKVIDSDIVTTGLRSVRIVQEPDSVGKSFYVELNGRPVFAKGANYIPNDNFLPRVTKKDYDKVIDNAVKANMNMLRVWGGGIYENDYFYELCDKNGLLVWQDFMFACSMYPGDAAFLESVRQEAIENVVRLRNHPSIALWCGNNEIDAAWQHDSKYGWGWKERYTEEQRNKIFKDYKAIFHEILPEVVSKYTDGKYYWPSSPMGGEEINNHSSYSSTSGDIHYWGVWHGKEPFENFRTKIGRFMSEYGFQSFPDFETVQLYTTEEDWNIESDVMMAHQRSGIGNLRIKEYMSWYYQEPKDFSDFLYVSQVQQAYAIRIATEAHRIKMPYTMGTLYWQINDCWPVASWSSTDYTGKWKAQHYAVQRTFRDLAVFTEQDGKQTKIWIVSDKVQDEELVLQWKLVDFAGTVIEENSQEIVAKENTSSLAKVLKNENVKSQQSNFLYVSILKNGIEVDNQFHYFVEPKDLKLQKPEFSLQASKKNNTWELNITSNTLVKDVWLSVPNKSVTFSDNYFDLPANKTKTIVCTTESEVSDLVKQLHVKTLWDSYN